MPARVRQDAERQLKHGELGRLGRDQQIACERELEAAAERMAVDRGNHRLVQIPQFGQAGEAAGPIVDLPPFAGLLALMRGLEVPAGGEDAVARPGDDADAQLRIVAQQHEGAAERAARLGIDRVDLGPVERHFEHVAAPLDAHWAGHAILAKPRPFAKLRPGTGR